MAKYFSKFPKTIYNNSTSSGDVDTVTNIISRFTIEQSLKDNTSGYYKYQIQDGDTPEAVAYKVYGSAEKHWVILNFNTVIDPQFDWPMEYRTLNSFINEKYLSSANTSAGETGLVWAQSNTKSYFKIRTKTDNITLTKQIEKYEVDANSYANVTVTSTTTTLADGSTITIDTSKETQTYYEYELEQNENKRTINILKKQYVEKLEAELTRVFS